MKNALPLVPLLLLGGCVADITAHIDATASDGSSSGDEGPGPCEDDPAACECVDNSQCPAGTVCVDFQCVDLPGECGNGQLDPGEQCDDGPMNQWNGYCKPDCTVAFCGDGLVGPMESCDVGDPMTWGSCVDYGFAGGQVECMPPMCEIDTSGCFGGPPETAQSCSDLVGMPSGVYAIDPDFDGPSPPFDVYCDMDTHGGGWMLVAEIGRDHDVSPGDDFTFDSNEIELLDGMPPHPLQYSHLDLARFDSYGFDWTLRTQVDAFDDGTHHQYTFFRSLIMPGCMISQAGANWWGTDTANRVEVLVSSSTTGIGPMNSTWIPPGDYDIPGSTFYLLGKRDGDIALNVPCLAEPPPTTQDCHFLAGTINDEPTLGVATAAESYADGVPHGWGHGAQYWLKATRINDASGN